MATNSCGINSALNQNKDLYRLALNKHSQPNGEYMANNVETDKFELERNKFLKNKEKQAKQSKTKKTIGYCVLVASVIAAIFTGKQIKKNGLNLEFLGISQEKSQKITKNAKNLWNNFYNLSTNAGSVRDDFARQIVDKTEKTPFSFIKKGANSLENLYNDWTKKGAKNGYTTLTDNLKKIDSLNQNQLKQLANFDEFFDDINEQTRNILTEKGKSITGQFFGKQPNGKMKPIDKIFKMSINSIVADDKISQLYKKYTIKLTDAQKADKALAKMVKERNTIVKEAIERLRDTNLGNPISDAVGIIASLFGLGGALLSANDSEERKSVSIKLGIPIITTITSVIIGSAKSISGVKSMVFGAALGMVGSGLATTCDKLTQKKNLTEELNYQNQNT